MSENLLKSKEDLKKESDKKAVVGLIVVLVFGIIFYMSMSKDKSGSQPTESVQRATIQGLDNSAESNKISRTLDDLKAEDTKLGKPRLKSAELIKAKDGSYEVIIHVRADDVYGDKERNSYMRGLVSRVFYTLYSNGLKISSASVSAVYPFIKDNNVIEMSAYTAILDNTDLAKIDWKADKNDVINNVIPTLWKTGIIREGFGN